MDRLEALGNQLSQITMYDIKSMYNQAKNMVLNVSEMEAKVREATNDDPWGASSTLMQEIAQGTFNFQQFNEIMPCIYSRFMEKEAKQWREIYKALQLLEYLIKNGSERVVDDARSHLSTIKMLRNFHYIDEKGKDQGLNVRNRSRELSELLTDVDKIRTERRKAKANRSKYVGTGNEALSLGSGRYGGFGSDSLGSGSYSGSYDRYDDTSSRGFRDEAGKKGYDEYDAGDYETPSRSNSLRTGSSSAGRQGSSTTNQNSTKEAPKEAPKVTNLLDFDDDEGMPDSSSANTNNKALPNVAQSNLFDEDDEFAEFQTASPAPASAPASAPAPMAPAVGKSKADLFDLLNNKTSSASSAPYAQSSAMPAPLQQPIAFSQPPSVLSPSRQSFSGNISPMQIGSGTPLSPLPRSNASSAFGSNTSQTQTHASKPSSAGNFDDLWNLSLGSASKPNRAAVNQKSIKDIAQEKANANIWGGSSRQAGKAPASQQSSSGIDDLLF